jgi:putative ABC transport system ATP-binding protein
MISMKKINKSYTMGAENLHVLKDIDMEVEKGEYLAILGPSGSGKSTLMNLIGCMDNADSGEYFLGGAPVHTLHEKELTRIRNREIGFVFQKYHLIPKYNVVQNIIMPLLMRGETHWDAEKMCQDTIAALGLSDRMKHKPSELSGGQQQRVAIARALVGKPSVLLADEPTGALDSHTGQEILQLFEEINARGNTVIVITHDLNVAKHARRIVKIIDGKISAG